MRKEYIYRHIRHIAIRSCFLAFIPLTILLILIINIPFKEVFYPSSLTYANSANTKYEAGNDYISITLNNAYYSGYDCIKHGKVYGSYYYCLVNNSCTFILVNTSDMDTIPPVLNDYFLKGKLIHYDSHLKEVLKSLSKDIGWTYDGLKGITSPIMIDETKYNLAFYTYLAFALAILMAFSISFIIINLIYLIIPGLFPSCICFYRLSNGHNQLNRVNYELNNRIIMQRGSITLTENYIVAISPFNIQVIPIDKIIWAYEHTKWHKIFWYRLNLFYTLNILCEKKIHVYVPQNKKEDINAIIDFLQEAHPDIIFGFSKENKSLAYKKIKELSK